MPFDRIVLGLLQSILGTKHVGVMIAQLDSDRSVVLWSTIEALDFQQLRGHGKEEYEAMREGMRMRISLQAMGVQGLVIPCFDHILELHMQARKDC